MYALNDYDYNLPKKCIAQHPVAGRDRSKLLILDRNTGHVHHYRFNDLGKELRPGDVLVVNDTAVIPARIFGQKETGGKIEVLLLEYPETNVSSNSGTVSLKCLIKASKRPQNGSRLRFDKGVTAIVEAFNDGIYELAFTFPDPVDRILEIIGSMPLPPYIERPDGDGCKNDSVSYQTVYAKNKGAVAAPTAGLHFTPNLLQELKTAGITIAPITLHVGYGTFSPVRSEDIRNHTIHTEPYWIPEKTAHIINTAKRAYKRIIAVGTTTCRTLEYAGDEAGNVAPGSGSCDLYIYPGYRFRVIDALITNFHLPQSTLLMLVSALAGREQILSAYQEAITKGYRFYSYGDAMLIK